MGLPDYPDWPDMPQPCQENEVVLNEYEMIENRMLVDFCKYLAQKVKP